MILEERKWSADELQQLKDKVDAWQDKIQEEKKKEIQEKTQQEKGKG